MTKKVVDNPFSDKKRLLLPLGTRMDEFEEFFVAGENMYHGTDYIDNPGEHGTDTFYYYQIDGNDIWVQCIFYQDFSREENEKERTETTYIGIDKIFTKGVNGGKLGDEYDNYKDGKLTKDQKEWRDKLVRLNTLHLIEEDNKDRALVATVKLKSFLFFQTLGKEKSQDLIQNEIDKLGDRITEEDLAELNEIKETGTIKRPKHYEQLYCFRGMRRIAEAFKDPTEKKKQLDKIDKFIKELEADQD